MEVKLPSAQLHKYLTILSVDIQQIMLEVRFLLLLDPNGHFSPCSIPRLPRDENFRTHPLLTRHIEPSTFRNDILRSAGIKPAEICPEGTFRGSLSELQASNIYNGSFRILLTSDPARYLQFKQNTRQPTIFVLDSDTILKLAILDLTGLMK